MFGIKSFVFQIFVLACMLLSLPLLGVIAAGHPAVVYLQFPPRTGTVLHAPFSWAAFGGFTVFILAVVVPLAVYGVRACRKASRPVDTLPAHQFPWWGWTGVGIGILAWILAWTRFGWFAAFQPHTFTPLWLSYIIVINALCRQRTGRCLMTDRPGFFLLLFPASSVFWWFFEYLNRFVQNWHYTGVVFSGREYFWYATLCFSTVLPAVLSTRQWLLSSRWIRGYAGFFHIGRSHARFLAAVVLFFSAAALAGIGVWPNLLFPLVWICPLLIIVCLQTLIGQHHVFSTMAEGDWRGAVAAAVAALVCGLFWEMWNYFSLAKWQYSIPLVYRFKVFEMPLLGYAGYLPFGLACVVVAGMLENLFKRDGKNTAGRFLFL